MNGKCVELNFEEVILVQKSLQDSQSFGFLFSRKTHQTGKLFDTSLRFEKTVSFRVCSLNHFGLDFDISELYLVNIKCNIKIRKLKNFDFGTLGFFYVERLRKLYNDLENCVQKMETVNTKCNKIDIQIIYLVILELSDTSTKKRYMKICLILQHHICRIRKKVNY